MKQLMSAAVVMMSCLSSMAFAQEHDDDDTAVEVMMPGAAVQVRQGGSSATVVVPGAAVQANVNVRTTTQTTGVVLQAPGVVVHQQPVIVREQVIVQQPVVVREQVIVREQVVQQPVAFRDCGTGPNDPGCTMRKNGQLPMDGATFGGVLKTLRAQKNSITREEMATKMLARNFLTAAQLGLVMDAFSDHSITQLDVAKAVAPNVVNPQHALSHSTKFQNSISAEEYVEVMSAQSSGQ
ncbi:MAG: DUF4476 domain-containing protein [Myxococcus sp.]|nr:DUF4476 domain-containing protein [Myxococcus sp.]